MATNSFLSHARSWSSYTSDRSIRCQHLLRTYCQASSKFIFRAFIKYAIITEVDLDRPNKTTKIRPLFVEIASEINSVQAVQHGTMFCELISCTEHRSTEMSSNSFQSIFWYSDTIMCVTWSLLRQSLVRVIHLVPKNRFLLIWWGKGNMLLNSIFPHRNSYSEQNASYPPSRIQISWALSAIVRQKCSK